jgi:hypothetical protein
MRIVTFFGDSVGNLSRGRRFPSTHRSRTESYSTYDGKVWALSSTHPPSAGVEKNGWRPSAVIFIHAMGSRLPVTSPTATRSSAASARSRASTPGRMRMPVEAPALSRFVVSVGVSQLLPGPLIDETASVLNLQR